MWVDYFLLGLGIFLYVGFLAIFCFKEYKLFEFKKNISRIIYFIFYIFLAILPVFSMYDYFYRQSSFIMKNSAILGFIVMMFYIYFVMVYFLLLIIYSISSNTLFKNKIKSKKIKRVINLTSILVSISICIFGFLATKIVKVTNLTIGEGSNSLNIVAISDIHYGATGSALNLEDAVSDINNQNPDVVVLIGDIFDNKTSNLDQVYFSNTMAKINSNFGVYAVLGNHELEYNNIPEIIDFYQGSNITLLINEEVTINNAVRLIGRNDYYYGGEYRTAINSIISDSNLPFIVLDHQPQDYKSAISSGAIMQISGHTHNGQIFPANYLVKFYLKYVYDSPTNGLHIYNDFSLYITKGYGTWGFPIKTTGISEIVKINYKY